jgi:hypothetical protein
MVAVSPLMMPIAHLRPTQITLGYREVARKRRRWDAQRLHDSAAFFRRHTVPCVLGPGGKYHMLDQHHMVRALYDAGVEAILVAPSRMFEGASDADFWARLEAAGLCHPYDENGERRPYDEIPQTIGGLGDDVFRSLAGELREAGAVLKTAAPYSEFAWAHFLRWRIARDIARDDPAAALASAMAWAASGEARALPGWRGPNAQRTVDAQPRSADDQ